MHTDGRTLIANHAAMASADEDERISLCVGEYFKSFQQLEEKIQQYERSIFSSSGNVTVASVGLFRLLRSV